jgi:hypothetical protein
MRRLSLILVFISGGFALLMPLFYASGLSETIPYPDRLLTIPALLLGIASWWRVPSAARSWPVLACVVFSFLGVLLADETERGRGMLIFAGIAAAVPIASLIIELKATRLCAQVFITSSALSMLILMIASGGLSGNGRFGLLVLNDVRVSNPNNFSAQMGFAAILTMSLMQRKKNKNLTRSSISFRKRDAQLAILLSFFVLGILMSASRGAIITLLAVSTLFIASTRTKSMHRIVLCSVLSLVTLVILNTNNVINARFQDTEGVIALGDRLPIWQEAIHITQSDMRFFWLGVGTGGAEKALAESSSFDNSTRRGEDGVARKATHNSYVEWTLTHGLVGALLASWLFFYAVRRCWRLDRIDQSSDRKMLLAFCMIISMVTALYRTPFATPLCALSLAMLSGPFLAQWPKLAKQAITRRDRNIRLHRNRKANRPFAGHRSIKAIHDLRAGPTWRLR